jgi:hypothetical protein
MPQPDYNDFVADVRDFVSLENLNLSNITKIVSMKENLPDCHTKPLQYSDKLQAIVHPTGPPNSLE